MITQHIVPNEQRIKHTADLFGIHFPMVLEPTIYSFASRLSTDYRGGYWRFHSLSNGGFFMAPEDDSLYTVICDNGFQGDLSGEALGITACLYAYSHLSFGEDEGLAKVCTRHFHLLREFMVGHVEAGVILGATD